MLWPMKLNIGKLFHHCPSESPFWLILFSLPPAPLPILALRFAAAGIFLCPRHPDDSPSVPIQIFPASPMLSQRSPRSSAIASFSALVIVLHLPKVSLPATCSVVACPFSSSQSFLLRARTFANKVSLLMGIFVLYTMFTTYAAPLASLVIDSSLAHSSLHRVSSFYLSSSSFPLHSKRATVDVSRCAAR